MSHCHVLKVRISAALCLAAIVAPLLVACGKKEEAKKEEAPAAAAPPAAAPAAPVPAAEAASAAAAAVAAAATAASAAGSTGSTLDPYATVDRALAALSTASIAFNSPGVMTLDQTAQIELLLSLRKTPEELSAGIAAPGAREGHSVKASNRMEAKLSGSGFQITAITPEEQAVGATDSVQWRWDIRPIASGRQTLHLALTALISVEGQMSRRAIRTFDKDIEVEVRFQRSLVDFFEKNWQWVWATLLIPLAGWLWKKWKRSRGEHVSPDA